MPDQEAKQRLLQRIAGALQVPLAAFYRPPNAVEAKSLSAATSVSSKVSDAEREELLFAFHSLIDPGDRRRILELMQKMAECD